MQKTRVAVLRGGPSESSELSLSSGAHILRSLPPEFQGLDIFIDKEGIWHERGIPATPESILKRSDVVWNALHGTYGADGTVQNLIRHFGIPYTGPEPLPAAQAWSGELRADIYPKAGLRVPERKRVFFDDDTEKVALELFRTFPMPARIVFSSHAHDPIVVASFHELHNALIRTESVPGKIFIEEYISGKAAGCGVIQDYRSESRYALLPFELADEGHIHPGRFSETEKREIEASAKKAHEALGLRHYSASYFVLHPKRGAYILSTDSLPALDEDSRFARSLEAVGASVPELIGHVIGLARER